MEIGEKSGKICEKTDFEHPLNNTLNTPLLSLENVSAWSDIITVLVDALTKRTCLNICLHKDDKHAQTDHRIEIH